MAKNVSSDLTTEQLIAKKKTLKGILVILSSLVLLYLIYFIYKLYTGTWESNDTLATISLGVLGVIISTTSIQYSKVAQMLKNREAVK